MPIICFVSNSYSSYCVKEEYFFRNIFTLINYLMYADDLVLMAPSSMGV